MKAQELKSKIEEAAETTVFVIDYVGKYELETHTMSNGKEVEMGNIFVLDYAKPHETNLLDFMMESIEETTSPRGVEARMQMRDNEDGTFTVYRWNRANRIEVIATYDNIIEAEDHLFESLEYDFNRDDQRDTRYYLSLNQCEIECAEAMEISIETYRSYMHHMELRDQALENRRKREEIARKKRIEEKRKELESKSNGADLVADFFKDEKHPAPSYVCEFKESTGLSWSGLRMLYK